MDSTPIYAATSAMSLQSPDQFSFELKTASAPTTERFVVRAYTAKDWDDHRLEIARLYQDNTLEKIRLFMRQHHGLEATAKQYKDQFGKWNLYKNVRAEEMEAIVRIQEERAAINKQSAFRVRKLPVNPEKITRYIKEHPGSAANINDNMDVDRAIVSADTPAGISVYTPSNTGPQTPRAASSPPGTSTHNLATSLWQLDSAHILPTSNIISPPTVLSNPELFSAQPPSLEFLIIDHTSSSTDSGPPSPASPIPNIVHASTSGFMGQSPAPIHEDNPLDLLQESGSSQGIFQAHSIPPWSFSQPQLGQRISVQATPRYKQTEEDNLRGELSMRQTFYGAEHAETLTMLSKLAKVLLNQGRYRAAEEMTRKLLRVYSDGNKDNEIGRLKALHLLSDILYRQGNYSDTEKISLYTIQSRESLLGASHRDTVRSMTILALTYFALGRMTFAEELLVEIMETRKRYLGDEHRATLETLHYLGSTYSQMGRWNQAELLQTEALEIRRRVLGEEHINTLASMDALASTYRSQGLWSKAETLGAQTLKIMKRLLGEEHPNTLQSKMSLASTYYIQAKWLKAEEHQTQTLEIMKRVLGDEHPVTLNAMAQLANTWKSLDREDDAINLMVQSARLQLLKSGYSHPSTRFALGTLSHWGVPEFRIKTHSEFTDDNLRGTTPAEERHIVLETSTY